jgi:hypothetical protein
LDKIEWERVRRKSYLVVIIVRPLYIFDNHLKIRNCASAVLEDPDDLNPVSVHSYSDAVHWSTWALRISRHKHMTHKIRKSRNDLEIPRISSIDSIEIKVDISGSAGEVKLVQRTRRDMSASFGGAH